MALALKHHSIALDTYLENEQNADYRSEFVDGQVYAMVVASEIHSTVATTFCTAIDNVLPEHCKVWQTDMKVKINIADKQIVYYPDIMVACGDNRDNPYYRTNPILIVEVLSLSTQRIDLNEKLEHYTQIPSLEEYVVAFQDSPRLIIYRQRCNWQPEHFQAGESFVLDSVGLCLPVEAIYRRVRRELGL